MSRHAAAAIGLGGEGGRSISLRIFSRLALLGGGGPSLTSRPAPLTEAFAFPPCGTGWRYGDEIATVDVSRQLVDRECQAIQRLIVEAVNAAGGTIMRILAALSHPRAFTTQKHSAFERPTQVASKNCFVIRSIVRRCRRIWPEPRVYLAGPGILCPDVTPSNDLKSTCRRFGLQGLWPADGLADTARLIFRANIGLIRSADGVIADISPFRGPHANDGTAFEIGFARALGRSSTRTLTMGYS